MIKTCKHHGETEFVLEARGAHRCKKCRSQNVINKRRKNKLILIKMAGGKCNKCGYLKCPGALHFHHTKPQKKDLG